MRTRRPRVRAYRPIEIDGHRFASRKEARRYAELRLLEREGEIRGLVLQPRFELQPPFRYRGAAIRAITYVADFQYEEHVAAGPLDWWRTVIEDVKGHATELFKLKWKMLQRMFADRGDVKLRISGTAPKRRSS